MVPGCRGRRHLVGRERLVARLHFVNHFALPAQCEQNIREVLDNVFESLR